MPPIPAHELVDARLAELTAAIDVIESRVSHGEDLRAVVVDVLGVVFATETAGQDMQHIPGAEWDYGERVAELLADPATVDRIVAAVVDILKRG